MQRIRSKIPNALTTLRMLVIPLFLWLVFGSQKIGAALIVFAMAALTDWLDGFLARRWNLISTYGKIMDPLADKLLVLSALAGITFSPPFRLSPVIFFIILIRESLITLLREIYKRRGIIVPADKMGKIKTFMQMTGLALAYAFWAWMSDFPVWLIPAITIWFWLVAGITVVSGFSYLNIKASGGKS